MAEGPGGCSDSTHSNTLDAMAIEAHRRCPQVTSIKQVSADGLVRKVRKGPAEPVTPPQGRVSAQTTP